MDHPDFFLIGAMRAGTTSVYLALDRSPHVAFTPFKEPHHYIYPRGGSGGMFRGPGDAFAERNFVPDEATYRAQLRAAATGPTAGPRRLVGDASTMYLYSPTAAGRLREGGCARSPKVAVLREPLSRALSAFRYQRMKGLEPCSDFVEALGEEPARTAQHWNPIWHYAGASDYADQLARWGWALDNGSLLVLVFEEVIRAPEATLAAIQRHIGVEASLGLTLPRSNQSGEPRFPRLSGWVHDPPRWVQRVAQLLPPGGREAAKTIRSAGLTGPPPPPPLPPEVRERFRDMARRTESFLGRGIAAWGTD